MCIYVSKGKIGSRDLTRSLLTLHSNVDSVLSNEISIFQYVLYKTRKGWREKTRTMFEGEICPCKLNGLNLRRVCKVVDRGPCRQRFVPHLVLM